MTDSKTPWGGRFEQQVVARMRVFGDSLPVDARLWAEDIAGSKAHAGMLASQGIISADDNAAIQAGLDGIAGELATGSLAFDPAAEDIHMAVELELTRRIGSAGKRLHTARSRNDQVATDFRLWCKKTALLLAADAKALILVLEELAAQHLGVILPGYTHLQKAQPVLLSTHLGAWAAMLTRDIARLEAAAQAADLSPLGAAALAGTPHPINRAATATALGFAGVIENTLDAVSDRDFACDLLYASAMGMLHLSRMAEEIILWSSDEFGFITLSDAYSTGSSIMPQKKNPDFAELTRGKTGRVYGDLLALLTTMKALPLAYNKDMQEDKEGTFDAADTYALCLEALSGMLATLTINAQRMYAAAQGGFMAATDLADWLAAQGLPFREAHEVVGKVVQYALEQGKKLHELSVEELKAYSELFNEQALEVLFIEHVVKVRQK